MNRERLEKLAHHLIVGKLGVDHFDFRTTLEGVYMGRRLCGTIGCAMGELPRAFPDEWKGIVKESLDRDPAFGYLNVCSGVIDLTDAEAGSLDNIDMVRDFFDISHEEFCYLFLPYYTDDEVPGYLLPDATAEEVGQHIREFAQTGVMKEDPCYDEVGEAEERADERHNRAMHALELKLAAQQGGVA